MFWWKGDSVLCPDRFNMKLGELFFGFFYGSSLGISASCCLRFECFKQCFRKGKHSRNESILSRGIETLIVEISL